jgi:ribosomal protein S14
MPPEPSRSRETARCSWCGAPVEREDGYRLGERPGSRRAAFCRLEHVVPWAMQGPHWEAGEIEEPSDLTEPARECARCGEQLGEVGLLLVRHRGEHRIPDAFCSVAHAAEWAKSGGRFG